MQIRSAELIDRVSPGPDTVTVPGDLKPWILGANKKLSSSSPIIQRQIMYPHRIWIGIAICVQLNVYAEITAKPV